MKTTPNPSATKKSNDDDELDVPPLSPAPEPPSLAEFPPPLATVLLSVGDAAADVRMIAVDRGELTALGLGPAVTDDSVSSAVAVACRIATRRPSPTAFRYTYVILPETNKTRWRARRFTPAGRPSGDCYRGTSRASVKRR